MFSAMQCAQPKQYWAASCRDYRKTRATFVGRMRCTFVLVYTLHDDLADAPVSLNRRGGQFGRNDVLKQPGSVKEGHVRWPRRG